MTGLRNLRRGSGQSLDPDTLATCIRVLQEAQAQLPVSKGEQAALGQLVAWLGTFASTGLLRDSTAMEALDDPLTPSPSGLRGLSSRELSGLDAAVAAAVVANSPELRSESRRISRRSLLPDDDDALQLVSRVSSGSLAGPSLELTAHMEQLLDWDAFDVFAVTRLSRQRPLQTVTWALMQHFNVVDNLSLPPDKLRTFLKALEARYNNNPYHNAMHAADVTQNVGVMLAADDLPSRLGQLEVLAMLLAAAVHDVNHPGFGNAYMVNTSTEAAITWNDISVNENMHAAVAFRLLGQPPNNFLAGLEPDDYRFVRRTVIGIVLATDMASHADLVTDFSANVALLGDDLRMWPPEKRLLALSFAVHCADLGNPGKRLALSLNWSARISKEFFAQGDAEAAAGLPISRLCDRNSADVAASQLAFMEAVVAPSFRALSALAPNTAALALANVEKAQAHWRSGAVPWREWLSPSHEDFEPHLDGDKL